MKDEQPMSDQPHTTLSQEDYDMRVNLHLVRDAMSWRTRQPSEEAVRDMVDRFLRWPLPKTFAPDCGISFDGRKADQWNPNGKGWPIGTNLFTADEARQMFEHVLRLAGK